MFLFDLLYLIAGLGIIVALIAFAWAMALLGELLRAGPLARLAFRLLARLLR